MSELRTLTLNGKQYDCFVDGVARSYLGASAIVGSASGENIVVSDASNYDVMGLRIFGKTTQDGTPTPDAPVELVSAGDSGSITVNVNGANNAQSITLSTPNGLPGVPVTSGGNYIDANGQQWVCDEIDFARGVYVQRTKQLVLNGSEKWTTSASKYLSLNLEDSAVKGGKGYCSHFNYWYNYGGDCIFATEWWLYLGEAASNRFSLNVEALKAFLYANNVELFYVLANPIGTPLSEEELAAYADLHTYRNNTTVTNDASAHMELEYVMDAKKYIDSLVKEPPARIANVTLSASAWAGNDSLYSQVVTINGITEYSKVDLLPSVEQLAIFHNKDVAFVTENEDGVVTVFAIGDKPTQDYTMQVSITEVTV